MGCTIGAWQLGSQIRGSPFAVQVNTGVLASGVFTVVVVQSTCAGGIIVVSAMVCTVKEDKVIFFSKNVVQSA